MYEILPITAHQQSIFQRNPNFRQNHSREFRNKFLRLTLLMAITFTNCYQKKKGKKKREDWPIKKICIRNVENPCKLFCLQSHQSGSLPAYSTSGNQQLNYPSGTAALSAGFQLNFLAQALSTISRHDDYKCVARILCEMASGKLPGRSLGEQGSFEFLGRNVFTEYVFPRFNSSLQRESEQGWSILLFFSFQLAVQNRRRWRVSIVELWNSYDPWIQQSRKLRAVLPSVPKVSEGHARVGSLLE